MAQNRNQPNSRRGVLICGAYGHGNAGDEAILEAIVASLRRIDAEVPITVLSRTPAVTAAALGVEAIYTFDIPAFRRAAARRAVYLNGGGSLIQDITSRRSLWFYLYTLRTAKKLGCRVIMYGCGIGPVQYGSDIRLVRRVLNRYVDCITLREEHSMRELARFGVTEPEIVLSSDPALTLDPAPAAAVDETMEELGLDPRGKYLCFCLREWAGFLSHSAAFADTARRAWEQYGLTPVFLSINRRSDGDAADAVCAHLPAELPRHILRQPLETPLTLGVISRMAAVVSMRLHGLIFAAGQGVPLVGVSYDPKVEAFLDYIGQPQHLMLDRLESKSLWALTEQALSGDRQALLEHARALRGIEHRNLDCVRKLLEVAEA